MQDTELDLLKKRADIVGLKYHANIGLESLKNKLAAHMSDDKSEEEEQEEDEETEDGTPAQKPVGPKLNTQSAKMAFRIEHIREMTKLVRLRVSCLNPMKKDMMGEVITCGNSLTGEIKKFVPFGEATDNGYHVPYFIYLVLKDRKFNSLRKRKGQNGQQDSIEQQLVPEFALEILPPLTSDELAKLANKQAASHAID